MVVLFAIAWLALPRVYVGGGYIDYRVAWGASFFILTGLVPAGGAAWRKPLGWFFGALVLARIAIIATFWLMWEPTLAAMDAALSTLPLGARVFAVAGDPHSVSASLSPPLNGMVVVSRRQAFEANIFADISGQILFLREPYKTISSVFLPTELHTLAPEYNYVLVMRPEFAWISPRLPLVCDKEGPSFQILRVMATDHPLSDTERRGGCGR
jgi:hypothetical protein